MCFGINRSSARLMIWGGPSVHNHILVSIYSHRSTPTRLNMIKTGLGFYCAAINQLYYLKSKVVSENVTISRFVVFVMPALWCDNIEGKKGNLVKFENENVFTNDSNSFLAFMLENKVDHFEPENHLICSFHSAQSTLLHILWTNSDVFMFSLSHVFPSMMWTKTCNFHINLIFPFLQCEYLTDIWLSCWQLSLFWSAPKDSFHSYFCWYFKV